MDALRATLPVLRTLGEGLLQLVYPAVCHICLDPLSSSCQRFCAKCESALKKDPFPACWRCGSTVGPHEEVADGCARCRKTSFHFSRVYRLGPYEGLLREVVLRMKSQAGESLASAMGELFAKRLEPALADAKLDGVVAIPLHWRRRTARGYNQSEVIARSMAHKLRVPFLSNSLVRLRYTPQQVGLSAAERRANVLGAFSVRRAGSMLGKRVLLMDDVMTTNSTASEAAGALRKAGVAEVLVGVLAHRTV
ncbi:MAG TPA: ComF family protein [Gemmataceae bacterium]|jgi:ComF family protein|nr:ComF family protein [Gemmataceae bacterium]